MFVFKKNMIYINKLSPTVKLPFKEVKGSVNYRQSKACNMVDKLYREILPQFNKKEEISFAQAKKALKNVLKGQIDIPIRKNGYSDILDGGSDILYSEFTGQISKTTIDIGTIKNKIKRVELTTLLHEFQHVADQIFHPKYLTRNQKMANIGLYTKKYDRLYDDLIYNREFPEGKKDKKIILNHLRNKITKFLRGLNYEDKIDYLQDIRYSLISEKHAYKTQLKYAKKLNKKHLKINKEDLENENKNFMFDEKIKLMKDLAFEIIQKNRQKHALLLKKENKLRNINNN